jgi:hypothetical protein
MCQVAQTCWDIVGCSRDEREKFLTKPVENENRRKQKKTPNEPQTWLRQAINADVDEVV